MTDFPLAGPNERVALIVATGPDDPYYQHTDGAMPFWCGLCGGDVMLDVKSQALMPVPVYCIRCFASGGYRYELRRAR